MANGIGEQATRLNQSLQEVARSAGLLTALGSDLDDYNVKVRRTQNAYEDLRKVVTSATGAGQELAGLFGSLSETLLGSSNVVSGFFGLISTSFEVLGNTANATLGIFNTIAESIDAPSRQIRAMDNEIFNLTKRFGGTNQEAARFADVIKSETASDFSRSLYLTADEMRKFAKVTRSTNLTISDLNESISLSSGETNLLAVATAYSAATSMDAGTAARLLNTIIKRQGVDASEAAGMLGVYSGVVEETGLSIDTVTSSLNGAVQGFAKLGMSADFGRPMLEGFSRVVKDLGLGLEEAGGLASSLTSALGGITTNYANAFILSQRGGLDVGQSGGALGTSISLQARMLEAEKAGDQSEIGRLLMDSMRNTIASFGGGEIVTAKDADESPELAARYFTQQQLLKNQFGLRDDQTAIRTLDLLQQIDEAGRSGNEDAKEALERQLAEEAQGRDENLDEFKKANIELSIQSNLLAVLARGDLMRLREGAASIRETYLTPVVEEGGRKAAEAYTSAMAGGADQIEQFDQWLASLRSGNNEDFQDLFTPDSAENRMANSQVRSADTVANLRVNERITGQKIAEALYEIDMRTPQQETISQLIGMLAAEGQGDVDSAEQLGYRGAPRRRDYEEAILEILQDDGRRGRIDINISVDEGGQLSAVADFVREGTQR